MTDADTRTCEVTGCDRPRRSGNATWCEMHYYRVRRHGELGQPAPIHTNRRPGHYLWSRIEVTGFCWNWTGHVMATGYGRAESKNYRTVAHRAVYEELIGPIPTGLVLDHLCRNRGCVNPDHLEPVTSIENVRRGRSGVLGEHIDWSVPSRRRSVCIHGHKRVPLHPCLECKLIDTHRRRGKNCSVEAVCHGRGR